MHLLAHTIRWTLAALLVSGCALQPYGEGAGYGGGSAGKADSDYEGRFVDVVLTNPPCDICTGEDKEILRRNSEVIERVVGRIDAAEYRIDIAQFTWSVREIADAVVRAHERGVQVRIAMDDAQNRAGSVSADLREAGLDVRFVHGSLGQGDRPHGLQHAKFMLIDYGWLVTGSNNWSSTGTTINNENTLIVRTDERDPMMRGFSCHFEAIWASNAQGAGDCSNEAAAFTPGTAAIRMIRDELRAAEESVDVMMHHFMFRDLVKELAKAAERGVHVRVLLNAANLEEHRGSSWDRLIAAGAEIRYKRTNADAYQIMHHKLAIIDGRTLLNGSGNWSGSAFFNNFENFVRYHDPTVVAPFRDAFRRLWSWSLTEPNLHANLSPALQHADEQRIYFGNLHAHFEARDGDRLLDDGQNAVLNHEGEPVPAATSYGVRRNAEMAFEYARDIGGMDFLALSPHVMDERNNDPRDIPNMSEEGFQQMRHAARSINEGSQGRFLALSGMEWSTNSTGNHVGVVGADSAIKVERGRYDILFEELRERSRAGERPLVMLNHPRTFRRHEGFLTGNWDQIFGVNLLDIPNNSQRNKKFNDYGLDDFPPLMDVRDDWIAGHAMPDEAIVHETMQNLWRAASPYVRLMEVTLGRGKELGHETATNPDISTDDEGHEEHIHRVHTDFDYFLLRGFRIAPAASHDNHWANWGSGHTTRTAIAAPHLSESSLLNAIEAREVYASEDEDLRLRFYIDDRSPMGSEVRVLGRQVRASVYVDDPTASGGFEVRLYRGRVHGEAVSEISRTQVSAGWSHFEVELPSADEHFLYVEVVCGQTQSMAWSAPIWLDPIE